MSNDQYDYQWTIMLYLSSDNTLSEDMVRAVTDIEAQGAPKGVAITIQYDPRAPEMPTLRYALGAGITRGECDVLAREIEGKYGSIPMPDHLKRKIESENSADPRLLADFIRWSTTEYRSQYRMLILSGHGSGAVGDFLTDANAKSNQPGSLTIPRLKDAFELAIAGDPEIQAKKGDAELKNLSTRMPEKELTSGRGRALLHVLGMDSCLMGMAEVCHVVQPYVQYLVGSEGFVPNAGWPYDYLLDQLNSRDPKDRSPEHLAEWIVDDVISHYDDYVPAGVSIDLAACKLAEMHSLNSAVAELSKELHDRLVEKDTAERDADRLRFQDLIVAAHWRAQSYKRELHTDLSDFCQELKASLARWNAGEYGALIGLCDTVVAAVDRVVIRKRFCGVEFQYSHGLSVYFPWARSAESTLRPYKALGFANENDSAWSTFLERYLKSTQRPVRDLKTKKDAADTERKGTLLVTTMAGPAFVAGGTDHKEAERVNREAERVNREAERVNRFIAELYSGFGTALPWTMKNPPTSVAVRPPGQQNPSRRKNRTKGTDACL
jgi:cysteine peptidase C11 family protein